MSRLLLSIFSLLLATSCLFSLTSCGHTFYGMGLDIERMRSRVPQTGQARYRDDTSGGYNQPYQYPQQAPQTPPPANNSGTWNY